MATGDISAIIDSVEFTTWTVAHELLEVYPGVYLVSWSRPFTVHASTFTVDNLGNLSAILDTINIDPVNYNNIASIHIGGGICVVAYPIDPGNDGWMKSFPVDALGNIGAVIGSLMFDAGYIGNMPYRSFLHVSGTVYAIAYHGGGNDLHIWTVGINNDGTFIGVLDHEIIAVGLPAFTVNLIHVSGNIYALVYGATGIGLRLRTISIDGAGNIALVDFRQVHAAGANYFRPTIIHVSGNVFAIVYQEAGVDNFVETLTISPIGTIGATIDTFPLGGATGVDLDVVHIYGDVFMVAAPTAPSYIKTLHIAGDGTIGPVVDTETIGVANIPRLCHAVEKIELVAAETLVAHGVIRSYEVDRPLVVAPTVTTDIATGTSTLNGTLDDDGGEACDCGFEYGETVAYGNTTPTQSRTTGQSFSQTIGGLAPGTTYHFRAFATNTAGTSYGADRVFVTPGALPIVTTDPATLLGISRATTNGTLDDDGGEACDCGFEYGLTASYGTTTPTQNRVTGETFLQNISGLFPGTIYHFRAFATNSFGTAYGADRTFTTEPAINKAYALAREEL